MAGAGGAGGRGPGAARPSGQQLELGRQRDALEAGEALERVVLAAQRRDLLADAVVVVLHQLRVLPLLGTDAALSEDT